MLQVWQQEEPDGRASRVLRRWVAFVQSYPKRTLALCVGLAAASVVYALLGLGFKTNRTDLVHPSQDSARDWKEYAEQFGEESDILVVIAGNDQPTMLTAMHAIAREIEQQPQLFEKLCYQIRTENLRAKGLYQLDADQLRGIQRRLEAFSPLLVGAWDWMSVENVLRATRFRLSSVSLEEPLDADSASALESAVRLVETLETFANDGRVYRSPWDTLFKQSQSSERKAIPEYFFSPDGKTLLLRVLPVRDSSTFAGLKQPVQLLRNTVARVQSTHPGIEIGLTGVPILEDDETRFAKSASTRSMMISVVGVALLFMIAFRAWRHPLYAIVTLAISGCWTIGWVTLTVGHLSVLSVSFIVTLVGLGIDFSILWLSRYESDLSHGLTQSEASQAATGKIGPGIVVGAVTTALAFFMTMTTELLGLREMGWIAGSGVLLCLIGSLTVLPAMLSLEKNTVILPRGGRRDLQPSMPWLYRHPVVIVTAFTLVGFWMLLQVGRVRFDYNLLNLQPRGLASVKWEERLIRETGTSGWYALSIANSAEEARRLKDAFSQLDSVGRVMEIASLIPSDQPRKFPFVDRIHQLVGKVPSVENAPPLSKPKLETLLQQLGELARTGLPLHPGNRLLVQRLVTGAANAHATLLSLSQPESLRRVGEYERLWFRDLLEQLNTLKAVSNSAPVTVADLPPSLAERYYNSNGKWLVQVFAKESIWDIEPLEQFYAEVSSVDPHTTGKPISTLHALSQMTSGYIRSAWLALGVIFLSVLFDLRNFKLTVLAMLPLILGVITMLGLMGALNIPLNPANMIALPLIVGIGIDFGVHVIHDYRETAGPYYLSWRLTRALIMTSMTTIIGFCSLLIARHFGMMTIGLVMGIGVSSCTVYVLFFLPALLNLLSQDHEQLVTDATSHVDMQSTKAYFPGASEAA